MKELRIPPRFYCRFRFPSFVDEILDEHLHMSLDLTTDRFLDRQTPYIGTTAGDMPAPFPASRRAHDRAPAVLRTLAMATTYRSQLSDCSASCLRPIAVSS